MRRIPVPICTCCNTARAEWESTRWPTVKLCFNCTKELSQFIVQRIKVKDGNPILLELVKGIDTAERPNSHRFWLKNPDGSFSECWVNETWNPELP